MTNYGYPSATVIIFAISVANIIDSINNDIDINKWLISTSLQNLFSNKNALRL